jgi:hypothetical protein
MSNGQNNDFNIDINPPPAVFGGSGGFSLIPGTRLSPRQVRDTTPTEGLVFSQEDFTPEGYVGTNLVNRDGVIARGQYSDNEAYTEIAKLNPVDRRAFLNTLQRFGVYGSSRPSSTGFSSQDFSAVREAMLYANAKGVTLDVALSLLATEAQPMGGGGGARIRTTPKEDLRAVFRQVSSQTLGRRLSDNEVEKFVKSYNRMEVSEATGGQSAPSAQVAAMEAVEAGNPDEAAAMGALQLTNIIDQAIKGLG